jgi:hypothetical protein
VHLRATYPRRLIEFRDLATDEDVYTNLKYLEEHGLCESGVRVSTDGLIAWGGSTITAQGIDFLEDDGGVSAILRTVTVRLHADTIRDLLVAKIEAEPIPEAEKSRLKTALKGLSETALKDATTDLVHLGIQHLPNALEWLRAIAGL